MLIQGRVSSFEARACFRILRRTPYLSPSELYPTVSYSRVLDSMTTAQAQTPLPALPSLTSNPTFFPTTPDDQDASGPSVLPGKTTSSTPYYPPLPTTATHQPAPVTAPRLLSTTPTRKGISAVPKSASANGLQGLSVSHSQASQAATDWEVAFERQEEERWGEKIRSDLSGWRGGHG